MGQRLIRFGYITIFSLVLVDSFFFGLLLIFILWFLFRALVMFFRYRSFIRSMPFIWSFLGLNYRTSKFSFSILLLRAICWFIILLRSYITFISIFLFNLRLLILSLFYDTSSFKYNRLLRFFLFIEFFKLKLRFYLILWILLNETYFINIDILMDLFVLYMEYLISIALY